MKHLFKIKLAFLMVFFINVNANSQVKIGANSAPAASAVLELESGTNKGFLGPKVALTSTTDVTTISSPATGLLVYNTATAGTSPNNVTPGYYYYTGSVWVSMNGTSNLYVSNGTLTGARTVTQGSNTLAFTSTATNGFSIDGTTFSVDAANNRLGLGTSAPNTTLDVVGDLATRSGSDITSLSSDISASGNSYFRINVSTAGNLTGISGGVNGKILNLVSVGSGVVTVKNNGSSTSANNILTGTGSDLLLVNGSSISLQYDATSSLWRVLSFNLSSNTTVLDYGHANINGGQSVSNGSTSTMSLTLTSTNMTYASNQFTLKAGRIYRINIGFRVDGSGYLSGQLYNVTAGAIIDSKWIAGRGDVSTFDNMSSKEFIYQPTTDIVICVKAEAATAAVTVQDGFISITQIGSMTSSTTAANGATGSVQYANASGLLEGDASNLKWDATNKRLGIGTNTPGFTLDVTSSNSVTSNFTSTATDPSGVIKVVVPNSNSSCNTCSEFLVFEKANGTVVGSITANLSSSSTSYATTSDIRLKENIRPSHFSINDLMKIQVADYTRISDSTKTLETGYLAQQLYAVFPYAVNPGGEDAKTNPWMVDYGRITPLIIKSVQDQQKEIEEQKAENKEVKAELELLKAELAQLKALINKVSAVK